MKRLTLFFFALFIIANLSSCDDQGPARKDPKKNMNRQECPDESPQKDRDRDRDRKW